MAHKDINKEYREIRELEQRITDEVLAGAEVLCTTNIGAGHFTIANRKFSIVLIDEATQATEPSSLVPIVKGARQLILVGDHKQLPPTVTSRTAEEGGLDIPLFEDYSPTYSCTCLQHNTECILQFVNSLLQDSMKISSKTVTESDRTVAGFLWPDWDKPVSFVPVHGSEIEEEVDSSRSNMDEAAIVVKIVNDLLAPSDLQPEDIGVISPYAGQVRLIKDMIGEIEGLEIKSVDGYQGREGDYRSIIGPLERARKSWFSFGFHRLNVALTRAKRGLIVVGDDRTLRNDPTWASWLDWVTGSI